MCSAQRVPWGRSKQYWMPFVVVVAGADKVVAGAAIVAGDTAVAAAVGAGDAAVVAGAAVARSRWSGLAQ